MTLAEPKFINASSLHDTIDRLWFDQLLGVGYYTIIAIMAIVGNIFIIYATSLIRGRTMDLMTISLIRTLAVNDLVGGLILYPHFIILLSMGRFPFHWLHCILLGICEIYFPLVSTLLVLTLVITKVAMIRYPFLCMKGPKRIYITVACLYSIGLLTPLGAFVQLGDYMYSPERGTCTYNFYPRPIVKKLYVIVCTTLFVIIPLIVIIVLSVYILRFVKKHRTTYSAHGAEQASEQSKPQKSNTTVVQVMEALNRVKPFPLVRRPGLRNLPIIQINGVPIEDEDNTDIEDANGAAARSKSNALSQRERVLKSVLVVLLVVFAYVLCWSMFFCVTTIAFLLGGEKDIPAAILLWQKALLMTNNALNPIVYILSNKKLQLIFFQTKECVYSLLSCRPTKPSRPVITRSGINTNASVLRPDEDEKRSVLFSSPAIIRSMKMFKARIFSREEASNSNIDIISGSAKNDHVLEEEELKVRAVSHLCNELSRMDLNSNISSRPEIDV